MIVLKHDKMEKNYEIYIEIYICEIKEAGFPVFSVTYDCTHERGALQFS